MNIHTLEVYKSPYNKVRLGRKNDGGYVIAELPLEYDCLLSCGISDDISFEVDFMRKYPNVPCYAFDGTIDKLPQLPEDIAKNFHYVKKNIGGVTTDNQTNLKEYLKKYNNVFVKMDIEGYEYIWLESLNFGELKKIKQFVVEFHHPFSHKNENMNKLLYYHRLIHFHPNNCCGCLDAEYREPDTPTINFKIPRVFECTYIRLNDFELSDESIPGPLDQPCVIQHDEIHLSGFPYNNK